jgi:hypothetical protein
MVVLKHFPQKRNILGCCGSSCSLRQDLQNYKEANLVNSVITVYTDSSPEQFAKKQGDPHGEKG